MPDPRLVNLARTLVQYSTRVKPKDHVAIYASPLATPLVEEPYRQVLWAGGCPYVPTPGHAQAAEISLSEFEDFVFGAMYADADDPVARWQAIHAEQEKVVNWLKGRKILEAKGPTIDMRLSIEGRTFINSDGAFNMPDGEVYTRPVEDSAEGWVRFTCPAVNEGVDGDLLYDSGEFVI